MTYTTRSEIQQVIDETRAKLGYAGQIPYAFSRRLTTTLGMANWLKHQLTFSAPLWPRATEAERYETIVHEVCHIVANGMVRKNCGHGSMWKALMRKCGLAPRRCHTVSTEGLRRPRAGGCKVVCACPGLEHHLGPGRTQKMLAGKKYICRRCRTAVRPAAYKADATLTNQP